MIFNGLIRVAQVLQIHYSSKYQVLFHKVLITTTHKKCLVIIFQEQFNGVQQMKYLMILLVLISVNVTQVFLSAMDSQYSFIQYMTPSKNTYLFDNYFEEKEAKKLANSFTGDLDWKYDSSNHEFTFTDYDTVMCCWSSENKDISLDNHNGLYLIKEIKKKDRLIIRVLIDLWFPKQYLIVWS